MQTRRSLFLDQLAALQQHSAKRSHLVLIRMQDTPQELLQPAKFGDLVVIWSPAAGGSTSLPSFLPSFVPYVLPSFLPPPFLPPFLPSLISFFLPSFPPSFLSSARYISGRKRGARNAGDILRRACANDTGPSFIFLPYPFLCSFLYSCVSSFLCSFLLFFPVFLPLFYSFFPSFLPSFSSFLDMPFFLPFVLPSFLP